MSGSLLKRRIWTAVFIVGLPLAAGVLAFALIVWPGAGPVFGEGKNLVFYLPEGFRGWALIKYEDPSCPVLEETGDALHIRIGRSAVLCTATRMPKGWRKTKYVEVLGDGTLRAFPDELVWPITRGYVVTTSVSKREVFARELFFVGSKEERKRDWESQPRLDQ